jgi:large conductance mechanosensitive channel
METKRKGIIAEFREFALRGNVVDMAVGVVLGAAFNAIVQALVNNIIMPIIGGLTAGVDFSKLAVKIGSVDLTYGAFISAVLNFFLVALAVFFLVKVINKVRSLSSAEEKEEPAGPTEVELLTEIRDLLKAQR